MNRAAAVRRLPARRRRSLRTDLAFFGAGATLAAAGGLLAADRLDTQRPALLVALALVTPIPILVRVRQRRWDPFEPITLFAVGFFVLFVMRPLADLGYDQTSLADLDSRSGFDTALIIALVGIIAVYVGYALPHGRRLGVRFVALPSRWDFNLLVLLAIGAIVFGLMLWAVFLAQSGGLSVAKTYVQGRSTNDPTLFRGSSGYFYLGPFLAIPAALLLLDVNARRRSLIALVVGTLSVLFVLVITVPRGDRTFVLLLILPLITQRYLRVNRRPATWAVIGAVILGLFAINLLLHYRRVEGRQQSPVASIVDTLGDPNGQAKDFLLGADTEMFPLMAVLVADVRGHVEGTTVTSFLASPVPGSLWPSKPRSPDVVFYKTVFPDAAQATDSGNALSFVGSYWYDSGYPGLLLLGLLTGIGFRALYEYQRRYRDNPGVQLFYSACLPFVIVLMRGNPTESFGPALFIVAPVLGCLWLASRRAPAYL